MRLPTNCGDGSSGGVSGLASSGTVRPETGSRKDLKDLSLVCSSGEVDNIQISELRWRLPVLLKRADLLLDNDSLLWVNDGGGGHDDGPAFTYWCGLFKPTGNSSSLKLKQQNSEGSARWATAGRC